MKIKVAVFFGGKSVEHEVSIISALQAIENIDKEKYEIYPIYITKENQLYYGDEIKNVKNFKNIDSLLEKSEKVFLIKEKNRVNLYSLDRKKIKKALISDIDVAFPILHGTNVEDGSFQGYLTTLDLPIVSPDTLESAVCMDKYVMKIMLKIGGFNVLPGLRFHKNHYQDFEKCKRIILNAFEYPVIVKPINLGSSIGISKANSDDELEESFKGAFSYSDFLIVEPMIENLKEVNCAVFGDINEQTASEVEEPISSSEILSYNDKYLSNSKGKTGATGIKRISVNDISNDNTNNGSKSEGGSKARKIPADISSSDREKIKEISKKAFKFLNLSGVCRIDYLINLDDNEIFINELNTIPGSLAFYLFEPIGIEYKTLLDKLIKIAIRKKKNKDSLNSTFDSNILGS